LSVKLASAGPVEIDPAQPVRGNLTTVISVICDSAWEGRTKQALANALHFSSFDSQLSCTLRPLPAEQRFSK
jgi:hypothetical protein